MENKTISMVKCPYCNDNWLKEEDEFVCKDCEEKASVDMAIASITDAIEILKKANNKTVSTRSLILSDLSNSLIEILNKINK
jgi:hypothetical protein